MKPTKRKMVAAHLYVWHGMVSVLPCALKNPEMHKYGDNLFDALGRVWREDLGFYTFKESEA